MRDYQYRVVKWAIACFGNAAVIDVQERTRMFLEEALELAQASGCTQDEAVLLVQYVFGRPVGEVDQEVGGVMTTISTLCHAQGLSLATCANAELQRCWDNLEAIKAKHDRKPKFYTPLPGADT